MRPPSTQKTNNANWRSKFTDLVEAIKRNITEFSWSTLCLATIIWPQFAGMNILFLSATAACVLIQASVYLSTSRNNDNDMSLIQLVSKLVYTSGRAPSLIAVSSLLCILSTVAPINLYFNNAMQAALNGGSFLAYQEAATAMLLWQAGFWVIRNIFTKVESQNIGTIDGALIMSLFTAKRNKANDLNEFKNKNENNIKNISRVDDITSNVYYYGQTILCAIISLISSIISVIQFELHPSLTLVKNNLIKRFFALSVFINLTSVWFSRVWVQATFTAQREEQQSIGNRLKSSDSTVAVPSKYLFHRVILNWRRAFQDLFQALPKAINDNNNFPVLLIVMSITPSFPLAAGAIMTVPQVIALGSAMKNMLMDSLVISRNNASWTNANSTMDTISRKQDNGVETPAAFDMKDIETYYADLDEATLPRPNWLRDLCDSCMAMIGILASIELLCSNAGVTFLGLGFSPAVLMTAIASAVTYAAIELAYVPQPQCEDCPEQQAQMKSAAYTKRFSNAFCNTMVTLLSSRLLCMFSPFFGEKVMSILSFGLTASYWPQISISAIAVNLAMTLIITPNLVPNDNDNPTFLQTLYGFGDNLISKINSFANEGYRVMSPANNTSKSRDFKRKPSAERRNREADSNTSNWFNNMLGFGLRA